MDPLRGRGRGRGRARSRGRAPPVDDVFKEDVVLEMPVSVVIDDGLRLARLAQGFCVAQSFREACADRARFDGSRVGSDLFGYQRHGYPCLSLHGAKDQTDRESTVSDFKSDVCNLLIATSIAARGLDVKDLELVINFHVPNHYEDYVHRVGRTGRAGRKGCAMTFISEEDARYAPDLVKALELSEEVVPDDLKSLADNFMAKVTQGLEQAHGTGYGGSGFKFNEEEDEVRRAAKKAQAKEYGFEDDKSDSEDEDEGIRKAGGDISQQAALAQIAAITAASKANTASMQTTASAAQLLPNGGGSVSHPGVLGQALPGTASVFTGTGLPLGSNDGAARAAAIAAAMNLQHNLAKIQADAMPEHYEAELEINDWVCFSRF
ncbi:hypothetical protein ACLB2K_047498 [Fragaria x ananassa]